jgi:hypothetical protein
MRRNCALFDSVAYYQWKFISMGGMGVSGILLECSKSFLLKTTKFPHEMARMLLVYDCLS